MYAIVLLKCILGVVVFIIVTSALLPGLGLRAEPLQKTTFPMKQLGVGASGLFSVWEKVAELFPDYCSEIDALASLITSQN